MTDAQCTAIIAAVIAVAVSATEDARRLNGEYPKPLSSADLLSQAIRLLDMAKAHYAPAEREAAHQWAIARALQQECVATHIRGA